jgi:hypothetical protein
MKHLNNLNINLAFREINYGRIKVPKGKRFGAFVTKIQQNIQHTYKNI